MFMDQNGLFMNQNKTHILVVHPQRSMAKNKFDMQGDVLQESASISICLVSK